jgi:hypothetical protein
VWQPAQAAWPVPAAARPLSAWQLAQARSLVLRLTSCLPWQPSHAAAGAWPSSSSWQVVHATAEVFANAAARPPGWIG